MYRLLGTSLVMAATAAISLAQGPGPGPVTFYVPPENPITVSKTRLGKALFWDEQLSSTRTTACGTCHIPAAGGSDPRTADPAFFSTNPGPDGAFGTPDDIQGSPGVPRSGADGKYISDPIYGLNVQVTGRKSPPAINAGSTLRLFWDGRAEGAFSDAVTGEILIPFGAALEIQALGPPGADAEMAHEARDWSQILVRLTNSEPLALAAEVPTDLETWIAGRSYPQLFNEVFGDDELTSGRVAMAIATYERTLLGDQTPDDEYRNGNTAALTPLEIQGRNLFYGVNGCAFCHTGLFYTDEQFHYLGVRPQNEDLGRFNINGNVNELGGMRTPGLRNVAQRAPYFANGSAQTLEDVIAFYNRGGDFDAPNKHPLMVPLNLSQQEQDALVAYLRNGLTDQRVVQELPPFDRVTLFSEDPSLAAESYGAPTSGSGGLEPRMVCYEPPALGNPNFTVAVDNALGGARAVLMIANADRPGGVPFRGTTSYLQMSGSRRRIVPVGLLQGSGAGGGYGSVTLALPEGVAYDGLELYAQWFMRDPGAAGGVSASEAMRFTLY